jgi:hypothetical protein
VDTLLLLFHRLHNLFVVDVIVVVEATMAAVMDAETDVGVMEVFFSHREYTPRVGITSNGKFLQIRVPHVKKFPEYKIFLDLIVKFFGYNSAKLNPFGPSDSSMNS